LRRYASFLVWPLLAWLCIYTVVPRNWPVEVRDHGWWQPFYSTALKNGNLFGTQHVTLFLDGHVPVWHLWFLPALLFSLAVVALLAGWRLQRYVILLIIGLYALALTEEVAGYFAHATVHLGLWSIAMLFTVLGWWLVGRRQPAISTALYMIVGGYAFALMEGEIMKAFFHLPPIAIMNHYYLGGIVLALGIFMLALAKPHMGQSTPLPFLAQFTFGIYVCHLLVIYTLIPVRERIEHLFPVLTPLWLGLFLLAVYFLAMLFTVVLSKIPLGRYLVTRPARMRHTYQCLTNRNE
jgi:surface polysaccharide O-acyltransferase-like enzyme